MLIYHLPGSIRSKKNSKRVVMAGRRRMVLPSKAYMAWEKQARAEAMVQHPPHACIAEGPVEVKVTAYIKGQMPDLSGVLESVGDALEGLAWGDDRQIVSWDGSRVYRDVKNPRTIVEVRECTTSEKQ